MILAWKTLFCGALALGLGMVTLAGCSSSSAQQSPAQRVDNPAAGTAEKPSNLSYGTVTAMVKKNVTTQAELLDLFGGPNISTTDKDGVETWVYERTSSVTDQAGSQQSDQMSAFFGAGGGGAGVVAGGGVAGSKSNTNNQNRTVNSIRTLTIVVKFNTDKTVKDYTARASYF